MAGAWAGLIFAVLAGGIIIGRRSADWYLPSPWLLVVLVVVALVIADEVVAHVS